MKKKFFIISVIIIILIAGLFVLTGCQDTSVKETELNTLKDNIKASLKVGE